MKDLLNIGIWLSRSCIFGLLLFVVSCEKQDMDQRALLSDQDGASILIMQSERLYNETFKITSKEVMNAVRQIGKQEFSGYSDFTITVRNGDGGRTKVTKMEIMVDGILIVTFKDFKGNASVIHKTLPDLTASSRIDVMISGSVGRFIEVSINAVAKTSSLADVEGNQYRTVKIGSQWWMAENLKTTKLNDGTSITLIEGNSEWLQAASDHAPAFSWYNNDDDFKEIYGALYNWAAAGNDKLCPAGWHMPSESEYYEMILFMDPDANMGQYSDIAGGLLKEQGTEHWDSPNTGATDQYGFTALPGGKRDAERSFTGIRQTGVWWSDNGLASINMSYNNTVAGFSEGGNEYGRSVRCIKDN